MADQERTQRYLEAFAKDAQRFLDRSVMESFRPERRKMVVFVRWRDRTTLDNCIICFRDMPRRRIEKRRGMTQ